MTKNIFTRLGKTLVKGVLVISVLLLIATKLLVGPPFQSKSTVESQSVETGYFRGREVIGELRTNGLKMCLELSHGGGQFDLPQSIQITDPPIVDAVEGKQHKIHYHNHDWSIPKSLDFVNEYQWLPSRKLLLFTASTKTGEQVWRWNPDDGFRPISKANYVGLAFSSVSLDQKYYLAHISESTKSQILICSVDGKEEFTIDLPKEIFFDITMLSRNEFLGQVQILNDDEYIKKWFRKENRFEDLPIKGRFSSVVVYNGALWGHRHEGKSSPFNEDAETANEIVRLNPDLKTIEQTISLPPGLEHFESRR